MKKILLLLLSVFLLTGCTSTNGIVSSKDLEIRKHENIKPLLERQKDIAFVPEDVKDFLNKLDQAKKNNPYNQD